MQKLLDFINLSIDYIKIFPLWYFMLDIMHAYLVFGVTRFLRPIVAIVLKSNQIKS